MLGSLGGRRRFVPFAVVALGMVAACGSGSASTPTGATVPDAPAVTTIVVGELAWITGDLDPDDLPPHSVDDDLEGVVRELWALIDHAYNTADAELLAAVYRESCTCWADVAKLADRASRGEHNVGEHTALTSIEVEERTEKSAVVHVFSVGAHSTVVNESGTTITDLPPTRGEHRLHLEFSAHRWSIVEMLGRQEVS